MKRIAFGTAIALTAPAAEAVAEDFVTVPSRDAFIDLVTGRELTRLGIRLEVTPDGEIAGSAFGTEVSGAWQWDGNYFCRDLYFGEQDLGPNCQQVAVSGDTVRFISDRGTGEYADLRLR
ncbi:dihydrodipicolinate reductase [Rhodobacterales bacterium HKCCE3408]|nr:dihydrodipicolinate reductase [Rhodobacterales bacterium HKCCE3408]